MTGYLAALRQSRTTEESVSLATQLTHIRNYAGLHGLTEVAYTEDKSTSGATPIKDRAGVGPWLTDPEKMAQYQTILAYKVDRVSRSLLDFVKLLAWCAEHDKRLVCVSEGIDTDTEVGRMLAQLLAVFAEFQRGQIRVRIADAKQQKRRGGSYVGAAPPFGYRRTDATRYGLEVDPVQGPLVRATLKRVLDGSSYAQAGQWLSTQTQTNRGTPWRSNVIGAMLNRVVYRGLIADAGDRHGRTPERDHTGAVKTHDAGVLITEAEHAEMKAVAANRAKPQIVRVPETAALLSGVAKCIECSRPLYKYSGGKRSRERLYYRCAGRQHRLCLAKPIDRVEADAVVENVLLSVYGHRQARKRRWDPGNETSTEIAQIEGKVSALLTNFGDNPAILDQVTAQVGAYSKRLDELKAEPQRKAGWVYEDSDAFFSDLWMDMPSEVERNQLLKELGATVKLGPQGIDVGGLTSLNIPGWPDVVPPDRTSPDELRRRRRLSQWRAAKQQV